MDHSVIKSVIERVAVGESVSEICRGADAPCSRSQFYAALAKSADLMATYDLARTARALAVEDEVQEIIDRLLGKDGLEKIDTRAAQVALNAKTWMLERMDPRRFGSRQETVISEGKSGYVRDLERAQEMIQRQRAEALPANVVALKKPGDVA